MQSFIQYRKFGRAVEQQLHRKRDQAPEASGTQSNETSPDQDLEKGHIPAAPDGIDNALSPNATPARQDFGPASSDANTAADVQAPAEAQEEVEPPLEDASPRPAAPSISRAASSRSSRSLTNVGTRLGQSLTGVSVRRKKTSEGADPSSNEKVFVVDFEGGDDPLNPHNWSLMLRIRATIFIALIAFIVGFASSVDSEALIPAAAEFGVSEVVESMATGLFLVGFGCGSLVAGPLSETVGRNPVYIATLLIYMIWIMASALAPNIGAQLVFRFLAGIFASTPLTCAGGSMADLWSPLERVVTFPIFANAAFTGPIFGPFVGGWIAQSPLLSWRWTEWITLIWSGLILGIIVLFQPETYSGVILQWKAKHMRRLTGEERFRAPLEVRADGLGKRLAVSMYRPFVMTAKEPIILLVALYLTVVYIILFTFLDGYDYIFNMPYGLGEGLTGTCFLGIVVGLFLASALVPIIYHWAKRDLKAIQEQGGDRLPPEFRLWYAMLGGGVAIPVSLFWMGWTARPDISIWSPLAASVLFGFGRLIPAGHDKTMLTARRHFDRLHFLLPVHHRLVRGIRSIRARLSHLYPICRGRWHGGGGHSVLRERRGGIHLHHLGMSIRAAGAGAVPVLLLRAPPAPKQLLRARREERSQVERVRYLWTTQQWRS